MHGHEHGPVSGSHRTPVNYKQLHNWFWRCLIYGLALWGFTTYFRGVFLKSSGSNEVIWLGICVLFAMMQQWCYYRASFGDPGTVAPQPHLLPQLQMSAASSTAAPAGEADCHILCRKCGADRPERAHHCSTCWKCVRRFDHHCPIVANCVGEDNHKFFIQFLLYTDIYCLMLLSRIVPSLWLFGGHLQWPNAIPTALTLLTLISQSSFVCFHLFLAAVDTTTQEWMAENSKAMMIPNYPRKKLVLSWHNLGRMMGTSPLQWLLPVRVHRSYASLEASSV